MKVLILKVGVLMGVVGAVGAAGVVAAAAVPPATAPAAGRGGPPARDPHTAGYVEARELPDGQVPPADADGNFILGPTHRRAAEMVAVEGGGGRRGR